MPTVRGKAAVRAFMAKAPEELAEKVLIGAARAAANVIADEVRDRSQSDLVADAVKVRVRREPGKIEARVMLQGRWANTLGIWLEYGTDPHFISVDDSQRDGKTTAKFNESDEAKALMIGGNFVGKTVFHPGARAHPFMRVSLDLKEREAVSAAQQFISTRVSKNGISGTAEAVDE